MRVGMCTFICASVDAEVEGVGESAYHILCHHGSKRLWMLVSVYMNSVRK